MGAAALLAQEVGTRAWQQRLHLELPLAVPLVALEAANPFSVPLDVAPRLATSTAPHKLDVSGKAIVAAYVTAAGECLGAVPLDLPFPGLTSALLSEFTGNRFEPARAGAQTAPSWSVVEISVDSKIRESEILSQDLALPDPLAPPQPVLPAIISPPANLATMKATARDKLSDLAIPKRVRLHVSARDADVTVRLLAHITPSGRCDRFVPLEMESGFDRWVAAFLATWRLEPAQYQGQNVDCWVLYSARARMKMSSMDSVTFRVLRDRSYDPLAP
jgi:hypothetical protein